MMIRVQRKRLLNADIHPLWQLSGMLPADTHKATANGDVFIYTKRFRYIRQQKLISA